MDFCGSGGAGRTWGPGCALLSGRLVGDETQKRNQLAIAIAHPSLACSFLREDRQLQQTKLVLPAAEFGYELAMLPIPPTRYEARYRGNREQQARF